MTVHVDTDTKHVTIQFQVQLSILFSKSLQVIRKPIKDGIFSYLYPWLVNHYREIAKELWLKGQGYSRPSH